ncbi:MAG: hypothetical protein QM705_04245 [Ancrocorticia sp.]
MNSDEEFVVGMILLGLLLIALPFAGGLYYLWKDAGVRRDWMLRDAEVVRESWTGGGDSTKSFFIRWVDDFGHEHFFRNPISHSGLGFLRSTPYPVRVYINPDNPEKGIMACGMGTYRAFGLVLLILPVTILVVLAALIL